MRDCTVTFKLFDMNLSLATPIMIMLFPLVLEPSSVEKTVEYHLHGIVTSKENGKALGDIYLYTVKGEEEAITNQKGEFRFVTWKKLPVTIHVHYRQEEDVRVVITNPAEVIKIKL
jgi:hypothetical protein